VQDPVLVAQMLQCCHYRYKKTNTQRLFVHVRDVALPNVTAAVEALLHTTGHRIIHRWYGSQDRKGLC
jgi:hypothetical protein